MMSSKYIEYLDNIVEQIQTKNTINVPSYMDETKYCSISSMPTYNTYIFTGCGSKNILKHFMNKTKSKYNYNLIVQLLDLKGNRQFMPIVNWDDFWNVYHNKPIQYRHLFEVILSNKPCKPYLDIEWKYNNVELAIDEFIPMIQVDLIHIFEKRYDIKLTRTNILILTAHTDIKASFHIIINKLINSRTCVYRTNKKHHSDSAWDLYIALTEHKDIYKLILDGSVYSTDREYRTIYSNKFNDFRPFIPYNKNTQFIANKKCLNYMVTYTQNNKHYYIATNYEHHIDKITYCDTQPNYILSLAQNIHPTAVITCNPTNDISGWRCSYSDKTEPCYTGNYHDSNGFYIFKHPEKGHYIKCMSSMCKGVYYLEKPKKLL